MAKEREKEIMVKEYIKVDGKKYKFNSSYSKKSDAKSFGESLTGVHNYSYRIKPVKIWGQTFYGLYLRKKGKR